MNGISYRDTWAKVDYIWTGKAVALYIPISPKLSDILKWPIEIIDKDSLSESKVNKSTTTSRSSSPDVFLGKAVLKICNTFTGGQPCRSMISIKL